MIPVLVPVVILIMRVFVVMGFCGMVVSMFMVFAKQEPSPQSHNRSSKPLSGKRALSKK